MEPETNSHELITCSCCGRTVNGPVGRIAGDHAETLCDGCYLSALAPDHRIQGLETFD